MNIKSLRLQRFRSCADVEVSFCSDLTVLVGENNGGKTGIIDALRLLTLPLNGRRDRYPEDDDVRSGATSRTFQLEGRFSGLSDTLKGLLISAVPDPSKDSAIIGMTYHAKIAGAHRGKTSYWAGRFENSEPEAGSTDLIRHVYLPPLRDASQALGSGSSSRITALLQHFLEDGEEATFLTHVRRNPEPHRLITAVNTEIGAALSSLASGVRPQAASLDFVNEALSDVARDLRFRLADAGLSPVDIRASGLGYANLLYMATVVVELAKAREADLTLFLVEEPEAHLHPQLQMLVLDFLLAQAKKSNSQQLVAGQPEGRIQIIATTHSPNLTAWVSPKHLVVIRSAREAGTPNHQTSSISVESLALAEPKLKKIGRYLDVTRSALLFGNRALLVEGVAESLLLPAIAKTIVFHENLAAFQRFRGAVLVAIDGVDFSPYVEILLKPISGSSIADRVVVITDADPKLAGNRRQDLETLAAGWGVPAKLAVFTNTVTLEHELFAAGNEAILKNVFLELHPRSVQRWETDIVAKTPAERPAAFVKLIEDTQTRKGDFAQALSERIEIGEAFTVPAYLRSALEAVAQL